MPGLVLTAGDWFRGAVQLVDVWVKNASDGAKEDR